MNIRPRIWMPLLTLASSVPFVARAGASDFMTEVRPILEAHCLECHASGRSEGGFSLETRESMLAHDTAVSVGDSRGSLLMTLVRGEVAELQMPFGREPLSDTQIAILANWIDRGAPWPDGFVFQKVGTSASSVFLERAELPPAAASLSHPIDRILDRYAVQVGVELSPRMADANFMRRATLDLVGLLPEGADVDAFVEDPDLEKRVDLVRSLLGDGPSYAAHWLSFWNDLLRNDYSGTGYIDGGRKQISSWLYRALLDNKPYDQFVTELVDPIPDTQGFAAGIAWRGDTSASQIEELQYARVVSQVFLGTNVKCASCHDSFINQWKLRDTYGLAAIIAERPLELHRCDQPTGELARAAFLFPELGEIDAAAPREQRLERFAELLTSPENGRFSRTIVNRLWQRLMGRGLVEPVDDMEQPAWSSDLLDYLAADLVDNDFDLKRTLELIATSRAYQRQTVALDPQERPEAFVFRGPAPKRLTAEQFVDVLWRLSRTGPDEVSGDFGDHVIPAASVRSSLVVADGLMRSLGRPNREQVVSTRPSELVTLQALELTNGAQVSALVRQSAEHLLERGLPAEVLIERLFLDLLSRRPEAGERGLALELLSTAETQAGVEDLLWILLMHPDFQMVG